MKSWWIAALAVVLATTLTPSISEAKRLGGGKSTGMQRDMPARTAPDAAPAKPAAPTQAAAPATAGAAAAAAAPGKRSWMGPLAGLAAGLGLAALASHLGFGDELASFMMLALLAVAVIALIAFVRRRMAGGQTAKPALAAAGAGSVPPTQVAWPAPSAPTTTAREALAPAASTAAATAAPVAAAFVPASFDAESFERIAKMIFIRLQAANDTANLDDLRQFTTPEMFASIKLDLLDRGATGQTTEVTRVEAKVIDIAEESDRQVVSVRYRGEVVEAAGAAPTPFDEVWHLVKPHGDASQWAIAGIEQMV
jgi:predicted lipid-binding transport protein (Tim44 family)